MTAKSMTGFARVDGNVGNTQWYWEIRSVNGRGLDIRLRLPPGSEQMEMTARKLVSARLKRGSVNITLVQRVAETPTMIRVNEEALMRITAIGEEVRARLDAPPLAVDNLLGLRGVLETVETEETEEEKENRSATQLRDLENGLEALIAARAEEGARLSKSINGLVDEIERIVVEVRASPSRTPDNIAQRLSGQLARLLGERSPTLDADRLHQEAALLALKADVEEELERLDAHIASARELLASDEAVGRRLDFLTQEFNREANTLCSKSNAADVTRLGLSLKTLIDQMREQVQNIE